MGGFLTVAELHSKTAALQKEYEKQYGTQFDFLLNEETEEGYMIEGTRLMKGSIFANISENFLDLLEHVDVWIDSSNGNIGIHVRALPYGKTLQAALLNFQKSDSIGFDQLIRHIYRTKTYLETKHAFNQMIYERLEFEYYFEQLGVPEQEMAKKKGYIV